ncbi:MAG: intradiol ring-cleavage dioxygenase [Hahellaceae bacterium]|nr:intradiol ring-cleavage dioxygenase [Hahellaceae bacterium]MCP5168994.1 intradiol ring-cleavage dioxygenase [Hahellaceae bacterium]
MSAFSVLGASLLTGCDDSQTAESLTNSVSDSETVSATTTTTSGSCVLIPQETEGPYPLTAVLSNSAMVRKDITEGKGGVPLTLKIKLVDVNNACQPVTQASIYVWHCDKDGVYSGYAQPGTNTVGQTFCRGIQDVDENGEVTFTTIYPGWYSGRITHIHFQVFLFSGSVATATSQIAFPQEVTQAVYNSLLYVAKGQNTSVTSFARDNVFSDGTTYQMATLTGSTSEGYLATLDVGIAV